MYDFLQLVKTSLAWWGWKITGLKPRQREYILNSQFRRTGRLCAHNYEAESLLKRSITVYRLIFGFNLHFFLWLLMYKINVTITVIFDSLFDVFESLRTQFSQLAFVQVYSPVVLWPMTSPLQACLPGCHFSLMNQWAPDRTTSLNFNNISLFLHSDSTQMQITAFY